LEIFTQKKRSLVCTQADNGVDNHAYFFIQKIVVNFDSNLLHLGKKDSWKKTTLVINILIIFFLWKTVGTGPSFRYKKKVGKQCWIQLCLSAFVSCRKNIYKFGVGYGFFSFSRASIILSLNHLGWGKKIKTKQKKVKGALWNFSRLLDSSILHWYIWIFIIINFHVILTKKKINSVSTRWPIGLLKTWFGNIYTKKKEVVGLYASWQWSWQSCLLFLSRRLLSISTQTSCIWGKKILEKKRL